MSLEGIKKAHEILEKIDSDEGKLLAEQLQPILRQVTSNYNKLDEFQNKIKKTGIEDPEKALELVKEAEKLKLDLANLPNVVEKSKKTDEANEDNKSLRETLASVQGQLDDYIKQNEQKDQEIANTKKKQTLTSYISKNIDGKVLMTSLVTNDIMNSGLIKEKDGSFEYHDGDGIHTDPEKIFKRVLALPAYQEGLKSPANLSKGSSSVSVPNKEYNRHNVQIIQ